IFPGDGVGQVAGDRDYPLLPAGVDPQHREPRIEVVERDALDHAVESVGHEEIVRRTPLTALRATGTDRPTPSAASTLPARPRRRGSTAPSTPPGRSGRRRCPDRGWRSTA